DGESIEADLVVDAGGRGSKTPSWLRELGFEAPFEEKVEVQLSYTTRIFKRHDQQLGKDKVVVIAPTPSGKRGGVIIAQENGRWMVTLFGHFGITAPVDLKGFIDFAKTLPSPDIYDLLREAEPVDDACTIRYPASTRRRYEKLSMFPEGFLVFGDAICSFNPIYGQGMTVAAMQAIALQDALVATDRGLAKRFFKKASRIIDNPWKIAVGADLRMPETPGRRSLATRFINRYIAEVHKCAHTDRRTARAFVRVAQLLEEPSSLMRPRILLRVLSASARELLRDKDRPVSRRVVARSTSSTQANS
ncbi:MAG TPA: hypothetical protein VJL58_06145, partial [Pyrinomonadaceae bacterium]|nr:hypothetical protein [Pyrinomonadaceae bacterium]